MKKLGSGVDAMVTMTILSFVVLWDRLWIAWPLLLVMAAPAIIATPIAVAIRWIERRASEHRVALGAGAGQTAGGWVLERLNREPALGVRLVNLSDNNRRNHYYHESRTIALADVVHHGSSVADYVIAANQLGRALTYARVPWFYRITQWCWEAGELGFPCGVVLLVAVIATGLTSALPVAALCFAAVVLAKTLAALDEVSASRVAMRELRDAGLDRHQRRFARAYLFATFTRCLEYAIVAAGALAVWPQLVAWIGEGGVSLGKPPDGWRELVPMLFAACVLAGAASALWLTLRPSTSEWLRVLLHPIMGLALFLILFNQPIAAAAPWAVTMAAVPALFFPVFLLNFAFSMMPLVVKSIFFPEREVRFPEGPPVPSVPSESMDKEANPSRVSLYSRACPVLGAPLAYLYLERLFNS